MYLRLFIEDDITETVKENGTTQFKNQFNSVKSIRDLLELISDWQGVRVRIDGGHGYSLDGCLGNCYLESIEKNGNKREYTSRNCLQVL